MPGAQVNAVARPRRFSLDWFGAAQTVLIVVSAVRYLRCGGPAYVWVALAMALPAFRFGFFPAYRQRMIERVRQLWADTAAPERLPSRAALGLIVLPAGLFFLSQGRPICTGDSKPIALTACGLVRNGSSDLAAFAPLYAPVYRIWPTDDLPYFCVRTATGVHSFYHSGMVVFALPHALLTRLLGADLGDGGVHDRMEKSVASWLAAACLGLFFLLALPVTDAATAGLMTLLLATGSGLCSTVGQALWQHGGVIFWMLLALLVEFNTWNHPRAVGVLLQGTSLAMMFACRLSSAVFIALFGLWLLLRSPRRAMLVGLMSGLAFAPWAWYYQRIYANPLGPTIGQLGFFSGRWRDTLVPLLLSPDHGLLVYQPWILLALAAIVPSVRRGLPISSRDAPSGWRCFCILAIVPQVAMVASWYAWWGGQCWGSRLLVETVPFFALLCLQPLAALRRLAWGRRLIAAMAILAAFVQLTGVYLKADCRDVQPGLFSRRPEPPGSWQHFPFLTPFLGGHRR